MIKVAWQNGIFGSNLSEWAAQYVPKKFWYEKPYTCHVELVSPPSGGGSNYKEKIQEAAFFLFFC